MYLLLIYWSNFPYCRARKGLHTPGNLLTPPWGELKTIDMNLFRVNGPAKQAIRLLRKWEKEIKLNGWIHKTLTDKKNLFEILLTRKKSTLQ